MSIVEAHSYINSETSWVDLDGGVQAFLATPRRFRPPYAGVVIGDPTPSLSQHTQDLAAKFAAFGYVAVAPSISSTEQDGIGDTLVTAVNYLKRLAQVDETCIVALGEGLGAGLPHLLSSGCPDIAANILLYGGINVRDEIIEAVTGPTLGLFGELDALISIQDVRGLRGALERFKKSYDFKVFPGVPHDWMNDNLPLSYREPESEAAWAYILKFIESVRRADTYVPGRVRWSMATEYERS